MAQIAGACRFAYNLALEQRRDWYRAGRTFTFASQCRELTQLRAAEDWLKAAPVHPLQQALRDLERAYRNCWEGRTRPPTLRRKGINDSFRFPDPVPRCRNKLPPIISGGLVRRAGAVSRAPTPPYNEEGISRCRHGACLSALPS